MVEALSATVSKLIAAKLINDAPHARKAKSNRTTITAPLIARGFRQQPWGPLAPVWDASQQLCRHSVARAPWHCAHGPGHATASASLSAITSESAEPEELFQMSQAYLPAVHGVSTVGDFAIQAVLSLPN